MDARPQRDLHHDLEQLRARVDGVLARLDDRSATPPRVSIGSSESFLESAERAVAQLEHDEVELSRRGDEAETQTREWERRAMLAVAAGRKDDAREALEQQQVFAQLERRYRDDANDTASLLADYRFALAELKRQKPE